MSERAKRRLVWVLVLVMGLEFCWFAVSGRVDLMRLLFVPIGLITVGLATIQVWRLRRKRRTD